MAVSAASVPGTRKAPQRTCVGCRSTTAKRELTRVVRTPEGAVVVDPSGRRNGRGAYVHADPACWQKALARSALAHVLRTALQPGDRAALEAYAASLAAPGSASFTP